MAAGELLAVLITETLPAELPEIAGANATGKLANWPAASVKGTAKPLTLKPAPLAFI
jgi:hypothetical protein